MGNHAMALYSLCRHFVHAIIESIRLQPSGYTPPAQVITDPRSDTAFYVGVKTGSTPGLVGNALAAATALAFGIFFLTAGVE